MRRTADLEAFSCTAPADAAVRRVVLEGDPTQTVVQFASSENCDLIVMPTHGYGPFRRFLLGSVTAKVLHDAICPVWTGPHMERAPDYATVHFRNIVCALDRSEEHTSELQSPCNLVCRLLLEKKNKYVI